MQTQSARDIFLHMVQEALVSLYDPLVLRKSPLVRVLRLEGRHNVVLSLRQMLGEAIEFLQPNAHTPRDSK